ncbi:bifunctional glycosyltransferase/CDP-glycerol:glycerophosphate glycerophosphotransferase [Streptosporangium saharense]|uniref:bifunctional glycosyltransferase/CDP-glycerol:glycerophosphate glycerophosphotransferase n=1 Tax=Streptosporangium saharense TaxID=1706840 RepID=UPI00331DC90E
MPALSVIVPIYDVEPYLTACLESLACQTWRDIEVVMVDDGSPDTSAEIAARFAERDRRFRLVRQANAGLGAARNAGLRVASGELFAFVDSDDMLPPYALETMAATLAETGSDLVTGNVHRFNGRGAWRSNMHRDAFAERLTRTHVTRTQTLLRDRLVTNKLWRRSFWEQHRLRFPEGVLYEDTSVALPAHFLAETVDVLARPIYLWRERDGDSLSITQDRAHVRGIEDRFASVRAVRDFLLGTGRAAHVPAWDLTVLDGDLPVFLPALEHGGEDFRRCFLDLACDYLDAAGPKVFARLPAQRRARWRLVRERRLPELLELLEWDRTASPDAKAVRRLGRYHLAAPVPLPSRATRLRHELEPRQRIDDVRWEGGRLHVQGRVTLRYLSPRERRHQHVFAWFVREDTGRGLRVPVTVFPADSLVSREEQDWCGFSLSVDADTLAEGTNWRVDLWIVHRGMLRRDRLRRHGPVETPLDHHEPRPGVRLWPHWTDAGEFRVRVERDRLVVTGCSFDDDRLLLAGHVAEDPGPHPVLLVSRAGGGVVHRFPVDVLGERFLSTVDLGMLLSSRLPALPASSPEAALLDVPAEWRIEVEGAGVGSVAADPVAGSRHTYAGRDLVARPSLSGALVLREHARAYHVLSAEWTQDGDLELSGTAAGTEPAHLVVTSRGRHDEHVFPLRLSRGRFTVTLTPREVATLAGRLPLPTGSYGLAVRAGGRERRLLSRLGGPVTHTGAWRETTFETGRDGVPALTVGGDLRGEAQEARERRALRDRFHVRLREEEPLREAVLFDSRGGRGFCGDPRAIYEELRRRGTAVEFLWHVRDRQVTLPEMVTPVATSTREHFEALATCRYVVTDGALPRWFRRRPGQVVVQTWPGATPKRVGFDIDRGPLAAPAHVERLAREVAQWTHLVTQGPWSTQTLGAAFRRAGAEFLGSGFPGSFDGAGGCGDFEGSESPEDSGEAGSIRGIGGVRGIRRVEGSQGSWASQGFFAGFEDFEGFRGELLETGSPRDDALARPGSPGTVVAIRERLGLPEGKKVVLYAPTWRDDRYHGRGRSRFDLRLDLYRMWRALGDDHVVMVRRHPNTLDRIPRAGTGFVLDVTAYPDVRDLYLVADVLVTDYSSAMFDFAVTGRPILLYTYDLEHYRDEVRGFSFDLEALAPGPLLRTTAEVAAAIRDLDRVTIEYGERYRAFVTDLRPPADGGATARLVDHLFGHRPEIDIPRQTRKAIHDRPS